MRNAFRWTVAAGLVVQLACSGNTLGSTDGGERNDSPAPGTDAGPEHDSGPTPDAGPRVDAGPAPASCRRPLFPASAPWNQRIDGAGVDSESDTIIGALQSHGWGAGHIQVDATIHVICDRDGTAPRMAFTPTGDSWDPDCDFAPVPIVPGDHIEAESGYACESGGDCHMIVISPTTNRLYEQWRVNITDGSFEGGCLAVWDTSTVSDTLRGDQCSSADAGGFPIAAMLFDADEVASGHIDHAIRFILPNDIIRRRVYVRPATHATDSSGGANSLPYGTRLRLRADRYDAVLARLPNDYARTVARAMREYGMILSDGGNIALTAEDDENTTAKWDNDTDDRSEATNLGFRDLDTIEPNDFEMVDGGERIDYEGNCTRTPVTN